jgi:hypothetical protein
LHPFSPFYRVILYRRRAARAVPASRSLAGSFSSRRGDVYFAFFPDAAAFSSFSTRNAATFFRRFSAY